MKPFISQLAKLALASLAVYALILFVTLIYMPPQRQASGMDTARAQRTLFATEPKYVFLNRSRLNSTHDKILILGASNAVVGLKQDQLQQLVGGAEVNNLSVGGSNVTQLRQIVELVHEVQSTEARHHNTFVLSLWYGLFADDSRRWNTPTRHAGDTDIDIERYRYGFFRRTEAGPIAVLPPQWLDIGVLLIHPHLVIDKVVRDMTKTVRRMMTGDTPVLSDAQRNAMVVSEQDKHRYLAFWEGYMGSSRLAEDQFQALEALIEQIIAAGGSVIVADLPLPSWHAQRSPYYAEYRQRIQRLFNALDTHAGVSVLQVKAEGADDDFSDEVHPKPRVTRRWAQQLAMALNKKTDPNSLAIQNTAGAESPESVPDAVTTAK